jgi:hypothetical protein
MRHNSAAQRANEAHNYKPKVHFSFFLSRFRRSLHNMLFPWRQPDDECLGMVYMRLFGLRKVVFESINTSERFRL